MDCFLLDKGLYLTTFLKHLLALLLISWNTDPINIFDKKTPYIKVPHQIKGNHIQKKVWAELKKIKKGNIKTYGKIAKTHKISPRYVGKICGQNELLLLVPCHRVIRSDGSLGGFTSTGGIKLKKKLLDFEKFGITKI